MKRKYDGHFTQAQKLAREAVSEGDKIKWQTAMFFLMVSKKLDELMGWK